MLIKKADAGCYDDASSAKRSHEGNRDYLQDSNTGKVFNSEKKRSVLPTVVIIRSFMGWSSRMFIDE